jgi:hypothetical protein
MYVEGFIDLIRELYVTSNYHIYGEKLHLPYTMVLTACRNRREPTVIVVWVFTNLSMTASTTSELFICGDSGFRYDSIESYILKEYPNTNVKRCEFLL